MTIFDLFNELDEVIMLHFSDVEAALQTDRGRQIVEKLLSEDNRALLREWYRPKGKPRVDYRTAVGRFIICCAIGSISERSFTAANAIADNTKRLFPDSCGTRLRPGSQPTTRPAARADPFLPPAF